MNLRRVLRVATVWGIFDVHGRFMNHLQRVNILIYSYCFFICYFNCCRFIKAAFYEYLCQYCSWYTWFDVSLDPRDKQNELRVLPSGIQYHAVRWTPTDILVEYISSISGCKSKPSKKPAWKPLHAGLVYSSILKIEAMDSSETSVDFHGTTQDYKSENIPRTLHCWVTR
jgi:hypothetical protein